MTKSTFVSSRDRMRQRLLAAVGRQHVVAVSGQNRFRHRQQQVLVVHHQNGFRAVQILVRMPALSLDELFFRRQINPHRRARARLAGNRHAAAVIGDDAVNQRQSEAAMSAALGGERTARKFAAARPASMPVPLSAISTQT